MAEQGAYGQRLGDIFQLERAPAFVTRSLQKSSIAVTEIKCDIVNNGLSAPIPREDAFLLTVQLQDCPRHDLFIDDRQVASGYLTAGSLSIYDLRSNPTANGVSPFHSLHFYIPRASLDVIADMEGCSRVDAFDNDPGIGVVDPVLQGLALSILPAFRSPTEANQLFVDHITIAVAAHALKTYGVARGPVDHLQMGLAPWQVRRAKERLSAQPDGDMLVSELASECGLPTGAFLRAFRQSTGTSPHRWLLRQRIEHAKVSLKQTPRVSLQQIALSCGFSSEQHLKRAFRQITGTYPTSQEPH